MNQRTCSSLKRPPSRLVRITSTAFGGAAINHAHVSSALLPARLRLVAGGSLGGCASINPSFHRGVVERARQELPQASRRAVAVDEAVGTTVLPQQLPAAAARPTRAAAAAQ